ncbi:ABC transporter substrate-binding protein (plasmid) [Halobaculum sp. CBA1158]|uniref:ABC transporter substrate-binding protein n=1 Tax=Halobaculum sp. CBA1158 TaxID=2904243 RepID=UPI001F1DF622|nr:ABC transporter substrate-binding protein [Halobaculum sp. CBA1158]UIP01369.1 ABC transporter substrate-binding protein [Halobaculum sp. CBA1158]
MKYGGAVVGGGLLAGCTGDGAGDAPEGNTSTEDETTDGETEDAEDQSYSVTMEPMGEVTFESVPERAVVYDPQWADHLVALGQQDAIASLGFSDGYYTGYVEALPGVSVDVDDLPGLWDSGLDKEQFYELDGDVHHVDPCRFTSFDSGLDREDFEELEENVGPFFANRFSRAHGEPPEWCRDSYEFYSLWELLDAFAEVYQVESRSEALTEVRDEMLDSIYAELPPEEERPVVGLVVYNPDEESFSPYRLNGPGFGKAHTRPLRARDAFADSDKTYAENYEGAYDMEGMLEVDPDVLLHNFDWTNGTEEMRERTEAFFALDEHPVGRELTAVQNDRIYATGSALQGPIMNLFQVELSARQIYPELFGQAPEPGDVAGLGELFDAQRVADIVNGDI